LDAFPSITGPRVPLQGIPGSPPSLQSLPAGCRFQPRCPAAFDACETIDPPLYDVAGVQSRCLLHDPTHADHATGAGR
jgi:peptide/nickel transport system ATP-binding protein